MIYQVLLYSVLILYDGENCVLGLIEVTLEGQGIVVGNYDTTLWSNYTYMQFRGIPFAESPKGNLRFKVRLDKCLYRYILVVN